MGEIDISGVSRSVNSLSAGSRSLERSKREKIADVKDEVASVVEGLAEPWSAAGLSDREAEVAAYRQLGFTNAAIALMIDVSKSTVNEYHRRATDKIDAARRLVSLADGSLVEEKDLACPNCGERIRRSHGDITLDGRELSVRCRSCYETHTRRLGRR